MLALSRKHEESITLILPDGRTVMVQLVQIDRRADRAKLGVSAPPDIQIVRTELLPTWRGR